VLPFILAGLVTGSVYALAGVGLVLTYKTSGVFNFAHGAIATASAYLFYTLHVQHGMTWIPAAIICLFVLGPLLGVLMEWIARPLAEASLAVRVVSTVGVLLVIQSLAVIIYGTTQTREVPVFLPSHPFTIGSTVITTDQIIVFVVGAAATAGLYAYFRIARTGLAMRAVVNEADLLDISGTDPIVVRRWAWIIGVTFASASGVLLVPYITLDATTLTFLVVSAFGAAAVGRFTNLPGTYLGGLLIGVGASLATKYFTNGALAGLSSSLPFLVLFVVLLVSPRRRLAERARTVARSQSAWSAPWQIQAAAVLVVLVVLCLVPGFATDHLTDWTQFLAMTVLFLSLGLLVRTSGQVSLCHAGFMAIGVCAFSQLAVVHGWPWLLALLGAGVIAIPVGALLAIPAIRLSGLYLALATFGFGILLQFMFYPLQFMFGDIGQAVTVPTPKWLAIGLTQSEKSYYYLCLVIAVLATGLVIAITRSRLGRLLRALADSPTGLATSGASINATRVLVFCISAFLAAIAGALAAGAVGQAAPQSYLPMNSLLYFVLVVIGLGGAPWYAISGAIGTTLITSYVTNSNTTNWLSVMFGLLALALALTPEHKRASHRIQAKIDQLARRDRSRSGARAGSPAPEQPAPEQPAPEQPAPAQPAATRHGSLEVADLRVTFGGLVAVDGVSIQAPTGRITGLIGPNGAGKTTFFNACSGLNRPSRGVIRLDGADISRRGPSYRARRGLGRTFQQMELFDNLTVRENVALGLEGSFAGPNVLRHLASSRHSLRRVSAITSKMLRQCDLLDLADRTVGSLSTGQRRLVELARCLAGPARILLLDEPSSGLDRMETARFGEILRSAVRERDIGILLVEHDMALVTDVCEYVYVLDFGEAIFAGTSAEMAASPAVQAAYLGRADELGELEPSPGVTSAEPGR
jgi:ABC-type branched-subunit amino acid transport system ATPase component/branched-subunit amino acid ABC-type transport system permease component